MLRPVPLRCLIVDDNASFLQVSRAALERQGVTVAGVATTVGEGLQRRDELDPDVVLVDVVLGDESGFDLARQLAAGQGSSETKVIFISTHPEDDFADLVAESPAIGFLAKADLSKDAIEELLSRDAPGRPDTR